LTIAGFVLAPSAAAAQTKAATPPDDGALKSKIETRLKGNATLKDDSIDVAVDHGVVTLKGTVDSKAESDRAAGLAKIAGVTSVENKLEVHSNATGTTGKDESTADKVKEGSKKAVDKTKDAASEVGEAVTDAWITTTLKADFVNEDTLKGSNINVDTNNHVVTLKGTVASAAGRARAVEIAKTTKGVKRVVDTLTIAPPK
jgi:osmotically-inducible protein OsmY